MTYSIASPLPSVTTYSSALRGVQGLDYATLWKDGSNHVHIMNGFGSPFWTHYINTNTNAHSMLDGGLGNFGRYPYYDTVGNKLYSGSDYSYPNLATFGVFDPTANGGTGSWTVIATSAGSGATFGDSEGIFRGGDGLIYATFKPKNTTSSRCYSYDPAVGSGSWTDLGAIYASDDGNSVIRLYSDANYLYAGIKDQANAYWHFMVHQIGPWTGSWAEHSFGTNAKAMEFWKDESTGNPFVKRTTTDDVEHFYWITGGTVSAEITGTKPNEGSGITGLVNMNGCFMTMNPATSGDYHSFPDFYGWDFDVASLFPAELDPTSVVTYGAHATWPGTYTTSTLTYTGNFYDQAISAIAPHTASGQLTVLAGSLLAGIGSEYNYLTETASTAFTRINAYGAVSVPATYSPLGVNEIYWVGYAKNMVRWNPNIAKSGTNPKDITLAVGQFDYPVYVDYDANGLIWVGGNACGAHNPCYDFGSLEWYNPSTDTMGDDVFDEIWYGGNDTSSDPTHNIKIANFCMACSRTKIVVSSYDNYLRVVNCSTKAIEQTTNLGEGGWMVEVANDLVLGITGDAGKLFRYQPSTGTIITSPTAISTLGVSSPTATFGTASSSNTRKHFKLEIGPDGYAWLFVDGSIYRVNPTTTDSSTFTKVINNATYGPGKIKWAGTDLLVYYDAIGSRVGMDAYLGLLQGTFTDYSKGASASLPGTNADLTPYTATEIAAVATNDNTTYAEQAAPAGQYNIHEFKNLVGGNPVNITVSAKSDLAPSSSKVQVQAYNVGTGSWEDIPGASNSSAGANVDFDINISGFNPTGYLSDGMLTCRVYQKAEVVPSVIAEQTGFTSYYADLGTFYGFGTAFICSNPSGKHITSAKFKLKKIGSPTGSSTIKIYNSGEPSWGTPGTNGVPDTVTGAIATSDSQSLAGFDAGGAEVTFTFSGANQIVLTNGNSYCIVIEHTYDGGFPDPASYIQAGYYGSTVANMNMVYYTASWHFDASNNGYFVLYGV